LARPKIIANAGIGVAVVFAAKVIIYNALNYWQSTVFVSELKDVDRPTGHPATRASAARCATDACGG